SVCLYPFVFFSSASLSVAFPFLSSAFIFRSTFGTTDALLLLRFAMVLSLAISSSFPLSLLPPGFSYST
ncbi:hypothetical protein BB560_003842, partial [Smittium megazygosporum]